jgi:D-glycero-alpha-D-manno-heptose-7-phosphate kinase
LKISRTPLRISFGGGGTDLPSYYEAQGRGFLVAAAINKYIYIAVHPNFEDKYLLKYSQIENVGTLADIDHKLIRETLSLLDVPPAVEITSIADIPAGTGLGSSGAFTVGLLNAVNAFNRQIVSKRELADMACHIEIDRLKEPVGKQDQFIAAYGGLSAFEFAKGGGVQHFNVNASRATREALDDNLLLFFTGIRRSASAELQLTSDEAAKASSSIKGNLDEVLRAGYAAVESLESGDLDSWSKQMTNQWKLKLERSPGGPHTQVDQWIESGISAGALGGKLVGAGGGGFLLFYAEDKKPALRAAMSRFGLTEVKFAIDYVGSTIL